MKQRSSDDMKAIRIVKYILIAYIIAILFVSFEVYNDSSSRNKDTSWLNKIVENKLSFKEK